MLQKTCIFDYLRNGKAHRLGEWIQVAVVFDLHQLLFYINGARVGRLIREVTFFIPFKTNNTIVFCQ